MKVVILRGIPGAGKSTYIKNNYPTATVASADHYFTDEAGVYRFDISEIGRAHNACRAEFSSALARGDEVIVVDNTNVKARDFKFYIEEAQAVGYEVTLVRLECRPETAVKRGIHAVPLHAVQRMAESLENSELPDGWTETVVNTDESETPPACS